MSVHYRHDNLLKACSIFFYLLAWLCPIHCIVGLNTLNVLGCVYLTGDRFDIRTFHDQVLRLGPVPMNILHDVILHWVALHADSGGGGNQSSKMAPILFILVTVYSTWTVLLDIYRHLAKWKIQTSYFCLTCSMLES